MKPLTPPPTSPPPPTTLTLPIRPAPTTSTTTPPKPTTTPHPQASLPSLPHDILLLILLLLPTASDLRSLALSCRPLAHLIHHHAWRPFLRERFPSLSLPASIPHSHLAASLTWQSRAWDKRALQFQGFFSTPSIEGQGRGKRQGLFQPVIAARYEAEREREVVVWGAGEDLVMRARTRGGGVSWMRKGGKEAGYRGGYDDVRAVAVVPWEGEETEVVVTGRDSGEVGMVWGEGGRFGERVGVRFVGPGEGLETVGSLDVKGRMVAVAGKAEVVVYELPVAGDLDEGEVEVRPSLVYDLGEKVFRASRRGLQRPQVCRATWMGEGMMALALKSVDDPLRYLEVTPTGWTHHTAAKNARLEREFGIEYGNICPSSLTPVTPLASSRGGTSLLLSAWRDGSIRLQDLRTPSPVDMVYEDNIDPWSDMETLMTYGTERFIGGGMEGATIKIFDFRWSKGYQHTAALPCSPAEPLPSPPQPFLSRPTTVGDRKQPIETCGKRCNHVRGTYCLWHGLSRDIYYRPNASFFLSSNLPAPQNRGSGVWALAKGSDVSPNFYIGIAGGVIEAGLEPSGEAWSTQTDPHFGFPGWRDPNAVGAGYRSVPLGVSMMETGDGMLVTRNDRAVQLPPLLGTDNHSPIGDVEFEKRYRLDPRFYSVA